MVRSRVRFEVFLSKLNWKATSYSKSLQQQQDVKQNER
jgi:hypothetical protein